MHSGHKILTAIAFQESGLVHRAQKPSRIARGFWQFEQIGIDGVEKHPATSKYATEVRLSLSIERDEVYRAIEYNDVLAAAYARLLLWRHPDPIPTDMDQAWDYYIALWRPGKAHPARWPRSWMVG
jgi:hypothetical protein